jgi:hypothetical protein
MSVAPQLSRPGRFGGFSGAADFHRAATAPKFLLTGLPISWR